MIKFCRLLKFMFLSSVLVLAGCSGSVTDSLGPVKISSSVELVSVPADMSGYEMVEEEYADYRLVSMEESLRLFREKGTGIVYFGKDSCQYCQRALAELNKVALKTEVTIWYVDVSQYFSTETYEELMSYISEICPEDDDGNRTFYAPTVLAVKDGEITDAHVSLVSGFKLEDESSLLSDSQKKKLQTYYKDIILSAADDE